MIKTKEKNFNKHKILKNEFKFLFENKIESFTEIIFDILVVACLRNIFLEINFNFFYEPTIINLQSFWLLIVCLNILSIWFYFIYYVQVFDKNDFLSRIIFFFIFVSVGFFVFSTYYGHIDSENISVNIIRDKIAMNFFSLFISLLIILVIFVYNILTTLRKQENNLIVIKKIFLPFLLQLLLISVSIFAIAFSTTALNILISALVLGSLLFLIFLRIAFSLITTIFKNENNSLNILSKHLQNRFILLTTICLGEILISIFEPFINLSIFNSGFSSVNIFLIFLILIFSIIIVYMLYCIYVDRIHNIEINNTDHSLYWYIFVHVFIIISLIMTSYGISNEIHSAFTYLKNENNFINSPGLIIWGPILYLLSVVNIVFYKMRKNPKYTIKSFLNNLDLIIGLFFLMSLLPIIIYIINPFYYVLIIFIDLVALNIWYAYNVIYKKHLKNVEF